MKYIPFIPVGILMTVFGAKLSLASPISHERVNEYLLIFEYVESALLFSSMFVFSLTHTRTYTQQNIIKSVVVWFFSLTPFCKLFLNSFFYVFISTSFSFLFVLTMCMWKSMNSLCLGHQTAQNTSHLHTHTHTFNSKFIFICKNFQVLLTRFSSSLLFLLK